MQRGAANLYFLGIFSIKPQEGEKKISTKGSRGEKESWLGETPKTSWYAKSQNFDYSVTHNNYVVNTF